MFKLLRVLIAILAVVLMSLSPVSAYAAKPKPPKPPPPPPVSLGTYQTTDRQMDFAVSLCGKKGNQLCLELAAVRGSADTARLRASVGKTVVKEANPAGKNKWNGVMSVSGYKIKGSMTLSPTSFVLASSSCAAKKPKNCNTFTLIAE